MSYVIATTESLVRWYCFEVNAPQEPREFTLLNELDLRRVPLFPDKAAARDAAISLGLKTYRYVKI